jgi:hypothetical protein
MHKQLIGLILQSRRSLTGATLGMVLLAGCATPQLVGKSPSTIPPKLVVIVDKSQPGKEIITWDRPFAFGPVPAEIASVADSACLIARIDLRAIGYHPTAKDKDGNQMPNGGFFCWPKLHGIDPGPIPPKLVQKNGVLGWDIPSAFGAIPEEFQLAGEAACQQVSPGSKAIGFHPEALDENDQKITGGGFFCTAATN